MKYFKGEKKPPINEYIMIMSFSSSVPTSELYNMAELLEVRERIIFGKRYAVSSPQGQGVKVPLPSS